MKRRNFFKTALIGTGAIALAPALALGQDPLASIRQYYYNWYVAPRDYSVHVPSNNYWQLLSEYTSRKNVLIDEQLLHWEKAAPHSSGYEVIHGLYRIRHAVQFEDYDHVYQWQAKRSLFWMNVEDYVFYEELYRNHVLGFSQTRLLGVGFVYGIMNPLNPREALYTSPHLEYIYPKSIKRAYPPNGYEIHIGYQKR